MSKIWNKSWFEVDSLGLTRRKSRWSWSFRLKRVSEVNPSRSQKNKKWNFWGAGGPRNHCTSDLTKSRHTGNVQPNVAQCDQIIYEFAFQYILDAVGSSEILKGKQNLGVTFNFVVDPLFFGQKNYKGPLFISKLKET